VTSRTAPALANTGLTSARVRQRMVERVRELGVRDARVLGALATVPRHLFVDAALASRAYDDCSLPLGHGQTISQPYIVARSAELAIATMLTPRTARVLEIGTGSGYAAAVFAQVFGEVYSVERVRALHERARANLRPLRLATVRLAYGDGAQGLPADAPYDAIIAAAAGEEIPVAWGEQLSPGGVVVAPVGREQQHLSVMSRDKSGRWVSRKVEPVRFVPLLTGVIAA
jgi:protein-L-isoaspartate(D-aspartate) O-methyltransferase